MNKKKSSEFFPKIAVCLAAYNGKLWLEEQLDSILAQTGIALTIFISVDASSDGTENLIDAYASKHSFIFVLPYGMHFSGAAKNFFRILHEVDFSEFDYVSFADQDDIWLPNKLLRAHEMLSSTGASGYSSNVLAFWPNGRELFIKKSQPQVKWDFLFEAAGPGCTYVMKKELVCAIQDLLKSNWDVVQKVALHDWFVYAFARANGYHWLIDDYASMRYRQHEKNQVGVNYGRKAFFYRVQKILDGWWFAQSALIAQLVGLKDDPLIAGWSKGNKTGLFWLALHARQCRRRMRDKVLFAISCCVLSLVGSREL